MSTGDKIIWGYSCTIYARDLLILMTMATGLIAALLLCT